MNFYSILVIGLSHKSKILYVYITKYYYIIFVQLKIYSINTI